MGLLLNAAFIEGKGVNISIHLIICRTSFEDIDIMLKKKLLIVVYMDIRTDDNWVFITFLHII